MGGSQVPRPALCIFKTALLIKHQIEGLTQKLGHRIQTITPLSIGNKILPWQSLKLDLKSDLSYKRSGQVQKSHNPPPKLICTLGSKSLLLL